jgi:hypothetical protein
MIHKDRSAGCREGQVLVHVEEIEKEEYQLLKHMDVKHIEGG